MAVGVGESILDPPVGLEYSIGRCSSRNPRKLVRFGISAVRLQLLYAGQLVHFIRRFQGNIAKMNIPCVPVNTPPIFSESSPALCFYLHAQDGQARAATMHLPHGPVELPVCVHISQDGICSVIVTGAFLLHPLFF